MICTNAPQIPSQKILISTPGETHDRGYGQILTSTTGETHDRGYEFLRKKTSLRTQVKRMTVGTGVGGGGSSYGRNATASDLLNGDESLGLGGIRNTQKQPVAN